MPKRHKKNPAQKKHIPTETKSDSSSTNGLHVIIAICGIIFLIFLGSLLANLAGAILFPLVGLGVHTIRIA